MAGHSHWANIVHKKGAADKKRGKLFGKLSKAIMVAARNGGGDPDMNLRLRYAIDKARQNSMPKDTIERAVKKGTGELGSDSFEEILYEGYGPGGVAVMCDILTDNRNRTASEIRKLFEISGGNLGTSGCVAYLFDRKGLISFPAEEIGEEELMEVVLEAGAEDMKRQGDNFEILTDPSTFSDVQKAIEDAGITPEVCEISQIPQTEVEVDLETGQKVMKLMEALDDHDDIQNVYSNVNFSDELVAELSKEG